MIPEPSPSVSAVLRSWKPSVKYALLLSILTGSLTSSFLPISLSDPFLPPAATAAAVAQSEALRRLRGLNSILLDLELEAPLGNPERFSTSLASGLLPILRFPNNALYGLEPADVGVLC